MRSFWRFPAGGGPARRVWPWAVLALAAALALAAWAWSALSRELDRVLADFVLRVPRTATKVLDRHGEVIGVFAGENREVIPYGDIPRAFVGAVIATEDAAFLHHRGLCLRGAARAGLGFVTSLGRRREGASTLTMQLVRTVTARRQRRLDRKLKEVVLALKLERAFTKKQIFEQYANEVYFGGGRYGIEAAARYYFGKSAPRLSVDECALLAGLVQHPSGTNPYDPRTREAARLRRNHVLRRMAAERYLKAEDARALMERPIRLARENAREQFLAPYPVEEVRKYLYGKYGRERVLEGGLEVTTTLDSAWQAAANDAVRDGLRAVDRRRGFRRAGVQVVDKPDSAQLPGWERFFRAGDPVRGVVLAWGPDGAVVRVGADRLKVPGAAFAWAGPNVRALLPRGAAPLFRVLAASPEGRPTRLELDQEPEVEGALLAVEPRTGEIRAMVGGWDFRRSQFNRACQAERQAGSTLKPFVYLAAFTQGQTPAHPVADVPTRFVLGHTVYQPRNFEGDYHGPMTIWEAVRASRNLPVVRLLETTGIDPVLDLVRAAGIHGRLHPYPSLALGAGECTLQAMVRGYGTLANGGRLAPPPFLVRKIVDRDGRVLEAHAAGPGDQVLEPMATCQLVQCLQGAAERGTAARCAELGWPLAGKTGTTNDHADAWFVGFSTRIACGVWVGLDTRRTLYPGASGTRVALPIWVDFMRTALAGTPREPFPVPDGMEWAEVDRYTGLLAGPATPAGDRVRLAFRPGTAPSEASTPEAAAAVHRSRALASTLAPESRVWGAAGTGK